MIWDFAHAAAILALIMLVIRQVQAKLGANSDSGKALAYLFH